MFTCCRDHTTLRDFTALRRHHPRSWHRVLQRSVRPLRSSQTVAQALRGGGGGLLLARRSTRAEASRLKKQRHCARRLVSVYGDLPLQRITEDWLRLKRQRQVSGRHPISRSGDVVTAAFTLLKKAVYHRTAAYQHRQALNGQMALALAPHRRRSRLLLKRRTFLQMQRAANRTHAEFAAQFGIAKSTWSQVVNGKRGVTPQMQTRLLNHLLLKGRLETAFWEPEP